MRGVFQNRQGTPCSYGGVVYAYDARVLRVWRPADSTGAALCIGSQMGDGVNSQATNNVDLIITVWTLGTTTGDISLSNNISLQLHIQINVTPYLACVLGFTNGNIGMPISLRVLPLVPMLSTDSLSMCAFLFLSIVR